MVILGKKEIFARVDLWNNILQDVVEVEGRTCSPSVNVVTMCFRMSYLLFISVSVNGFIFHWIVSHYVQFEAAVLASLTY